MFIRKCVAVYILACGFSLSEVKAVSYEDIYWAPPLDVKGTKIVNAKGYAIQLKGFATMDPTRVTKAQVVRFRNDWHITLLRMPLLVGSGRCWIVGNIGVNASYLAAVDSVLKWCKENKIYVLFDGWHEGGQGNTIGEFSSTIAAWRILADRYKDQDHIIWEIFNEPHTYQQQAGSPALTWAMWVPMAERLIDTIRARNPVVKAIVAGTICWDQIASVDSLKINREKIIYSWHPYSGVYNNADSRPPKGIGESVWEAHFGFIVTSGVAPVMNTEWGFDGSTDTDPYGIQLVAYCKKKGISWTGWCYSTDWGPPMLKSLDPEVRNSAGNLMYNAIRDSTPFELTTSIKEPAAEDVSGQTIAINRSSVRFFCVEPSPVTLTIYTLAGRCVGKMFDQTFTKGSHSIPCNTKNGRSMGMAPGLYMASLKIKDREYHAPLNVVR